MPMTTALNRVLARTAYDHGCWTFLGALNRQGYGQVGRPRAERMAGGSQLAHRIVFEALREPLGGRPVDHLCRNPACVNPDHLEPVTTGENIRRGIGPTLLGQRQRSKAKCPQGHAYSAANTYVSPSRRRHCRECSYARKLAQSESPCR